MTQERWEAVDRYFGEALLGRDEALDDALAASEAAGLPGISVSATQGKLLFVLARAMAARRILEIGTLGGYSAIWLARALSPGGTLVTIEADPKHADIARQNLARAGLADRVDVRLGKALDVLPALAKDRPFDFVFIDADKGGYADYLDWAVRLGRPGTLIVADNVVRHGDVIDPQAEDPSVPGIRRFIEAVHRDPRVTATAVQTVGSKGYDGLALVLRI